MLEEPLNRAVKWAKVIDHTRCIGCHACTTACKSENLVPLSVTRTYVKHVDVGVFPQARRAHQVTRCNQCAHAPCVTACPTTAMFKRADGIVDFDKSICIGCKACMAACPYDAIFINPEDHSAEKCNFCAHRIDVGLEPACVVVCPTQAILIGDMNDTESYVAQIVNREPVAVRRPEKETLPKLFYKGAHQATLDPLAARRPEGGLFMWSEQQEGSATGCFRQSKLQQQLGGGVAFLRRGARDSLGLACQSLHLDQRHCTRSLSGRSVARVVWFSQREQFDLVVGDADCFRSLSSDHRRIVDLGPGTSGTFLSDLYAAAVAQLAGERRVHHCRLHAGAGASLPGELVWIKVSSKLVDDCGNSPGAYDGGLHRVSFRAGEGARHVAKPAVAAAFAGAGVVARLGGAPAGGFMDWRHLCSCAATE